MTVKKKITHLTIHHIAEGPAFVESFLLTQLQKEGIEPANPYDAYRNFIRLLDAGKILSDKNKQHLQNFYLGYYYEQASGYTTDGPASMELLEKAMICYRSMQQNGKKNGEEMYFSRLHAGLIMDALDYPWPDIEEGLLEAFEARSSRAESLEIIILHYIQVQQWAAAYLFSSFARERYLDKPPVPTEKWGVNFSLYQWQVLDLHTAVCLQMGMQEEAKQTFSVLLSRTQQQPHLFPSAEIARIQSHAQLINEPILA